MRIRPDRKLMDARRVGGVPSSRLVVSVFISLCCLFMMMPSHGAGIDDDDLLLLDFTMDRLRLASSVTAYTVGDRTVVSLAEAGAALEFPIVVDARSGLAKGWFIREARTFALDVKQGFVEVEGKRSAISEREVMVHDDGIFVTPEVFSQWFPVTLNLNASALTIEVEPREALPVQERMARRRGGQQIATIGPAKLPYVDSPYRLLGPPVADVGLGYSIRRSKNGGEAITGLNYSTLVAGDIAWMDGRLYLSGTDKEALSDARFTLSRDNLGLPLGLRYVEIGDINPVSIPGMSYGGLERGVMIQGGGSPIGRDDLISGDSMNISGDALPGWDVELFQNGMRLGLQSVGQNGRYDFRDIPPVGGANEFELVFYGPSGERRTEKVTRYSGLEPDQPGSVRYQFSVSEKGRQLYEPSLDSAAYLSDRGSARMSAGIDVRVLPRLSLRGAWNSVVVNGERLNYQSLGFRTGWRDMTVGADAIRDPFGGTRWDASLQLPASATFFGFDARFSHTHFAKTVVREAPKEDTDDLQIKEYTGEYTDYDLKLSSRTGVTLNGPIGNVATRFSYFRNQEESRSSNQFSAGFTSRYSGISFGNTLNYFQFGRDSNTGIQEDAYLGGNFFFSTLNPCCLQRVPAPRAPAYDFSAV